MSSLSATTTASHTMTTRPSPTLPSSLSLSSTSSSLLFSSSTATLAEISAFERTSTTASMFFEGDLLPVVFNNNNLSNGSINNTTLGLDAGSVGLGVGVGKSDDNLNAFYFYEVVYFMYATNK